MDILVNMLIVLFLIGIVLFGIIVFLVVRAVRAVTKSKTVRSVRDGFDDALDAIRGTKGTNEARRAAREAAVPLDVLEGDDVAIVDAKKRLRELAPCFSRHGLESRYASVNRLYVAIRCLTEEYSGSGVMPGPASNLGTALSFIEDAYPSMSDCLSVSSRSEDASLHAQASDIMKSLDERARHFTKAIENERASVLDAGLRRARRTVEFANQAGNGGSEPL